MKMIIKKVCVLLCLLTAQCSIVKRSVKVYQHFGSSSLLLAEPLVMVLCWASVCSTLLYCLLICFATCHVFSWYRNYEYH